MTELGTTPLERRLEHVRQRNVYPVYVNKYEPELVSLHLTRAGAAIKVAHLTTPWCGVEDCFHDTSGEGHVFIGTPIEVEA